MLKINLFSILTLITFNLYSQAYVSNSFEKQYEIRKSIAYKINKIRENPCEYSQEYNTDMCYLQKGRQLILNEQLSLECYNYAKYLSSINDLVHSDITEGAESLARTKNWYSVIFAFIQELEWDDDGHRRHITGNLETSYRQKHIGIGLYQYGNTVYTVVRTK